VNDVSNDSDELEMYNMCDMDDMGHKDGALQLKRNEDHENVSE